VRIARKHLGWYTQQLAGGEAFRREVNAADTARAQLDAVRRLFDRLAGESERLDYRPRVADVVDARAAFGRAETQALRGGEALAA
jgi:tRNA-dihydrouridine synthase B